MRVLLLIAIMLTAAPGSWSQKTAEQKAVEKAVIDWAGNTFEFYDAPRFEKFEALPSPDAFALEMQINDLKAFKEEIIFNYGEGKSDRTPEKLAKDTTEINKNIAAMEEMLSTIEPKYDGYEILFWANIRTNNGLTVYYQHRVVLTADYKVKSARLTSRVGEENDQVKIVYKD
jgi:hypothetical protein